MKNQREHSKASKKLLGYDFPDIHRYMDSESKFLGASHRIVGHSYRQVATAGLKYGEQGRKVALLHILLDTKIVNWNKK